MFNVHDNLLADNLWLGALDQVTSRIQAPAQKTGTRHVEPPTPPESSPPLHQTSVGAQVRAQVSQTAQARPLPSQNVPRPLEPSNRAQIRPLRSHGETETTQPSKRPKTRPQLSQSSPVRPQNVQEPLAPLNGIQGRVQVLQSSPARSHASQRSEVSFCLFGAYGNVSHLCRARHYILGHLVRLYCLAVALRDHSL